MSGVPSIDAVSLAPAERVPTRPFTDSEVTALDLGPLSGIRAAQRERFADGLGDGTWIDNNGATHWLVAPRPDLVFDPTPCLAVGFFGQARGDVDHTIIVQLEHAMLARSAEIPGLIAYHNVQLATTLYLDFDSTPPWRAVRGA